MITDVSKTKFLEFYNVLVWNTSIANYPSDAFRQKLLYVAITRAEENLIQRFKYEG